MLLNIKYQVGQVSDDGCTINGALSERFKGKLYTLYLTLTTDIWFDTLNMKGFLGATVHFGIDIELISVTLGVNELDERHTSQYISDML